MTDNFLVKVLNELRFLNHLIQIEQRVKPIFTWMLFDLSSPIVYFPSDATKSGILSYLLKKITFLLYYKDCFFPGESSQLDKLQIRKHLCHWEASSQMHTYCDYISYEWINYKLSV